MLQKRPCVMFVHARDHNSVISVQRDVQAVLQNFDKRLLKNKPVARYAKFLAVGSEEWAEFDEPGNLYLPAFKSGQMVLVLPGTEDVIDKFNDFVVSLVLSWP